MKYEAILFDLDGTLTNSRNAFVSAERESFREFGVEITDHDIVVFHRLGISAGMKMLFNRVPKEKHENLNAVRHEHNHRFLREQTEVYPDARVILQILTEHNIARGIVTSARRSHIESMNVRSKILDLLPVLATHDEVGDRTKPDPYGLEIACETLGINPKNGLYVGDARFDMEAAQRIGMDGCFIERRDMHCEQEIEDATSVATHHITSLADLPRIIGITTERLSA